MAEQKNIKLLLPIDNVVAREIKEDAQSETTSGKDIPDDYIGVDIGPKTIAAFREALKGVKTVLWNGPLGVFEIKKFSEGTFAIARAIAESGALSIVGGGDSAMTSALLLSKYAKKIYIPQKVIIARKDGDNFVDSKPINIEEKVPQGYMIVDFEIDKQACSMFEKAVIQRGRIVMAGTPCWVEKGFTEATRKIATYMNRNPQNSIALGEDTVSDMKLAGLEFKAQSSTGGGSALYFLAYGTTPVFEALKKNKEKFNYSK